MEFNSRIPIYLQVIDTIKKQLVTGKIPPGNKLPSTRELAVEYNINPNTAARIYKEMELMDICYTKRGLGTFATQSEERVGEMKKDITMEVISQFVNQMEELGYTSDDMVKEIRKRSKR
ncbi:MAG: GntR family transcriptional regulator [Clostridiales bacterium]|nr:GntR family transcriptional regulator [Clostridiales bacterium]